jgi:formyl-CoA transferase
VAEALSGLRYLNGYPGQAPPRIALSLGDSLAGMLAFQGVLAALIARQRSGRGQVVDVALTEASMSILESTVPDYDQTGHVRQPSGTRLDRVAPSNLYQSADGVWVLIAANQDTLFRRLCTAMGEPGLADDERFVTHVARGDNQDELDELIAAWAGRLPAEDLIDLCRTHEVVVGAVNTVAEVMREPQFLARELFVDHDDEFASGPVKGVRPLPLLSDTPGEVRWGGPRRTGTHNVEVYAELLGLGDLELAALSADGVI